MTAVKIKMVDVIIRKTLVKVKYFWYLVALLFIIDNVDPGPDLSKGILKTYIIFHLVQGNQKQSNAF